MNKQEEIAQLERMQEKLDSLPLLAIDRAIKAMTKTHYVPSAAGNGDVDLEEINLTQTEEK